MNIKEKLNALKSGKLSAKENIQNFLKKIEKENKDINAIIALNENALKAGKRTGQTICRQAGAKRSCMCVLCDVSTVLLLFK